MSSKKKSNLNPGGLGFNFGLLRQTPCNINPGGLKVLIFGLFCQTPGVFMSGRENPT
jgi:hypothetical protein